MLPHPTTTPILPITIERRLSEHIALNLSPLQVTPPDWGRLANIKDELHDLKRVQRQGEEDDLREALGRTISQVEDLSAMLSGAYKSQVELETALKLAKSNLQLSIANNEMLEDALKRETPGRGKDIGWRRGGVRSSLDSQPSLSPSMHAPITPNPSTPNTPSLASDGPPTSPYLKHTLSPNPSVAVAPATQDSRFFRFRFGSSANSRPQSPPALLRRPDLLDREHEVSHLTSASLPSLVVPSASGPSKREEELASELDSQKKSYEKVCTEKKALEAELESLSQALFEEANRMVAEERIKCAEMEEELRNTRTEKEALKGALRIIETENDHLRVQTLSPAPLADDQRTLKSRDQTASSTSAQIILHNDITPHYPSDFPVNASVGQPSPRRSNSSSSETEASLSEPDVNDPDPSASTPVYVALDDFKQWPARADSPSSTIALKTPPRSPSAIPLDMDELGESPWSH